MKSVRSIWNRYAALLLAFVVLTVTLSGCGMTLQEASASRVEDKSSGKTWIHASTCYKPVELGKKVGKLKVTSKESYDLHEIEDMDAELWLATEEGHVLYTQETSLPSLSDMQPVGVRVCSSQGSGQMVYHMTDAEQIASIVSAFEENEKIKYPAIYTSRSYRIDFESESYPGLYYTLTYVEYAEDYVVEDTNYGKYFLYNPFDQIFVPIGDEIYQALGPK